MSNGLRPWKKRKYKPKVLILREANGASRMTLAMALAWSALDAPARNERLRQADVALEAMRLQAGGRDN